MCNVLKNEGKGFAISGVQHQEFFSALEAVKEGVWAPVPTYGGEMVRTELFPYLMVP